MPLCTAAQEPQSLWCAPQALTSKAPNVCPALQASTVLILHRPTLPCLVRQARSLPVRGGSASPNPALCALLEATVPKEPQHLLRVLPERMGQPLVHPLQAAVSPALQVASAGVPACRLPSCVLQAHTASYRQWCLVSALLAPTGVSPTPHCPLIACLAPLAHFVHLSKPVPPLSVQQALSSTSLEPRIQTPRHTNATTPQTPVLLALLHQPPKHHALLAST